MVSIELLSSAAGEKVSTVQAAEAEIDTFDASGVASHMLFYDCTCRFLGFLLLEYVRLCYSVTCVFETDAGRHQCGFRTIV